MIARFCLYVLLFLLPVTTILAKPKKHEVVSGEVSVSSQNTTTTIHQQTDKAIIQWEEFSINQGEKVHFSQPSKKAAILNRVMGQKPSEIYGTLSSNGKIYLLNKNGIVIGPEGRIDTAGFIASTLEIEDHQFLAEQPLIFSGSSSASIVNLGRIETHAGDLFVLAQRVENQGTLKAENGAVYVGGATEILLKEDTPEQIFIRPGSIGSVSNEGTIEGIQTIIKAAGDNAYALALNQQGVIQATGVKFEDGKVLLCAEKGVTQVSGTVRAHHTEGLGGTIHLLGDQVGLVADAIIDVSGLNGGGEVLLGGDYQGKNRAIKNAENVFIGAEAHIFAQSTESGKGGKVIIWGDNSAQYFGSIDVSGMTGGGFVEVSSPLHLCYQGDVNLSSKQGLKGELFLDPSDITIGSFGGTSTPTFPTSPGNYNPPGSSGNLDIANLTSGLNSGNVTVSTSAGSGGSGNVTFNSGINLTWNAPTTFTILADGQVSLHNNIIQNTHTGSGNFNAIDFSGDVVTVGAFGSNAGVALKGVTITSVEGNISLTGTNTLSGGTGTYLWDNTTISSTGGGVDSATIQLTGSTTVGAGAAEGLHIENTILSSVDGDIIFIGTAIGNTNAIDLFDSTVSTTGIGANAGDIIFQGMNPSLGILPSGIAVGGAFTGTVIETDVGMISFLSDGRLSISSPCTVGSASMTGDIMISVNAMILTGSTIDILSTGVLTVQPDNPSLTMGVGGGSSGTLHLSTSNLDKFQAGFSNRIFGRADGTGIFEVGSYTYPDPITVYGKQIDVVGAVNAGANNVIFNLGFPSSGTLNLNALVTTTGTFQVNGGGFDDLFNINVSGQTATLIGNGGENTLSYGSGANTWSITSNNGGTVGSVTFSDMNNLIGGSGNDDFTLGGSFQIDGTVGIDGGGGTNSVTGPNVATGWTITGNNAGTVNPGVGATPLTNIQTFTGGSAADTFTFNGNFQLSGIDGGGGTNSVTGPNVATGWTITGNNAGTVNPGVGATPLTNIQTFTGGSVADTFTFNGNFQLSGIDGGGGANSVTGPNLATTWVITSGSSGTINPGIGVTPLTNIQTFTGGSANDLFNLSADITIPTLQAGGGVNTLTFLAGWTIPAAIDLNTTTGFQVINGPSGLDNTLTGNNLANTWHITGTNSGTLQNTTFPLPTLFTFTNFPNLIGGSSSDSFIFDGNYQLNGTVGINGSGGTNSVTGPNVATTWVITSGTSGTINPGIGVTSLTNIQTFTGGSANDLFNLSADITIPTLQAGGGINTLTFLPGWTIPAAIDLNTTTGFQVINGPSGLDNTLTGNNLANTWHITGPNSGTLQNTTFPLPTLFTFTNFPNLIGGTSSDSFIFDGNYQLNGTVGIDGGSGANSVTGPNVATAWTITGNNAGTINPGVGATPLTNIQSFTGGSAADTFTFNGNFLLSGINGGGGANSVTGPNVATAWTITGNNVGTINPGVGATPLTNIQSFTGGSAADTFTFNGNFLLSGIDGGGGANSVTGPN
ncbi:MAG: filamentous hemagglutinin N-terminal domain-containing protein, partial [Simkaniaceae bacterium]